MTGFVITVDFRLKPGAMGEFRRLIDTNARQSCATEPGCRRFDVAVPKGETDRIFLYEVYDDRAAFEAHRQTAHFKVFSGDSAALVESKQVVEYELACEGSQT